MNLNQTKVKRELATLCLHLAFLLICLGMLMGCKNTGQEENPYPEAEAQGLDGWKLQTAFSHAGEMADLQGLAVARNGVIVAEEYYNEGGPGPDPELHVMSVTKSITATLVGIAMEKGFIESVDQSLSDFLGEEVDTLNPDLGEVTLHQLMTMMAGHDWHELGGDSEFGDWVNAPDQLNYILNKAIVNPPGTVFNYSDGAAHLVSAILSKATGMNASAFANMHLFGPLDLGNRFWYSDNRGISYGGVGLCMGIHDMIQIDSLYLNKGSYEGRQLVPSDWIQKVTGFKVSTGNIIPFLSDYGYFWWLGDAHGQEFICANGYGGQFIFIVEDLNLVVCSRTNYRGIDSTKAGENWYKVLDLIINEVLPAVREE